MSPSRPTERVAGSQWQRRATGLDTTYRATTDHGASFALRIGSTMPIRSEPAVGAEAAWMTALGGHHGVAVSAVHSPVDGSPVAVVADADGMPRACLLLSWLPGRRQRRRFSTLHAHHLLQAMAALHCQARQYRAAEELEVKRWDAARMCGSGREQELCEIAGARTAEVVAARAAWRLPRRNSERRGEA